MKEAHESGRHLVQTGERILAHTIAAAVGFVLMVVGMAMGVTMVLLPVGIPVGLVGLLLFLWGLFSVARRKQT